MINYNLAEQFCSIMGMIATFLVLDGVTILAYMAFPGNSKVNYHRGILIILVDLLIAYSLYQVTPLIKIPNIKLPLALGTTLYVFCTVTGAFLMLALGVYQSKIITIKEVNKGKKVQSQSDH